MLMKARTPITRSGYEGQMTWNMGGAHGPDDTNVEYLQDSLLGGYASKVVGLYKCPDDILKCNESGSIMDRVRGVCR